VQVFLSNTKGRTHKIN